jgi:hypothetical protein
LLTSFFIGTSADSAVNVNDFVHGVNITLLIIYIYGMEAKPTDKKVNRLEVYIDASTKKTAKAKAKAEGKSLSQIVSTALNQFIEKK